MEEQYDKRETAEINNVPRFFRKFCGNTREGNYDLHCQEFAYSAIYGNLNTDNLQAILEAVGLSGVPNRLLLVQTDHKDVFWVYPEFNHFPRMFHIIQSIQKCLQTNGMEGMVADYLGRGIIGVFLRTGQKHHGEDREITGQVKHLAEDMIGRVNEENGEDITVGISSYCGGIDRFPQAYAECKSALLYSFRGKKNSYFYYKELSMPQIVYEPKKLQEYLGRLMPLLLDGKTEQGEALTRELIDYMAGVSLDPVDVRFVFISFADMIKNRLCDTSPAAAEFDTIYLKTARKLANSRFIQEIEEILLAYQEELTAVLGAESRSEEEQLMHSINETVAECYDDSQFNLEKIAQMFHYSPYHFGRLFKRLYGEAFNRYLSLYRIERAKELIGKKEPINEVAFETGFSSVSYFCTVFKNLEGNSPKQYRERVLAGGQEDGGP